MTPQETELLKMIRDSDDPERALQIATEIICQYLAQHGSFQGQAADFLQAPA